MDGWMIVRYMTIIVSEGASGALDSHYFIAGACPVILLGLNAESVDAVNALPAHSLGIQDAKEEGGK